MISYFTNLIRYRYVYIYLISLLSIFFLTYIPKVSISYTNKKPLPQSDPDFVNYISTNNSFNSNENSLVLSVPIISLSDTTKIELLINNLRSIEGIDTVLSAGSFNLFFKDAYNKGNPIFIRYFKTHDSKEVLIYVFLNENIINSKRRIDLVKGIDKMLFDKHFDSVKISGLPYIRTIYGTKVSSELKYFTLYSLLIISLILIIIYRSIYPFIYNIIIVMFSLGLLFAFMFYLDYEINLLTALIPPLIVVFSVQNISYLINLFHNEVRESSKMKSIIKVFSKSFLALLLTNLTTAVGFAVFSFSGSDILDQFSILSAFSVTIVWILSSTLLPILLVMFREPSAKGLKHLNSKLFLGIFEKVQHVILNKRKYVYGTTVSILLLSSYFVFNVKVNSFFFDDLPDNTKEIQDLKFIDKNYGGVMPLDVVVYTEKSESVVTLKSLRLISRLQDNIEKVCLNSSKCFSLVDFVKFKNYHANGDNVKSYRVPNAMQLANMNFNANTNNSKGFISKNQDSLRISMRIKDVGTDLLGLEIGKLDSVCLATLNESGLKYYISGASIVNDKGNKYLMNNLVQSLFWSVVIISLMILLLFMSYKVLLLAVIPNLIPLFLTMFFMNVIDLPLKNSTLIVFSIIYGIVIDLTINFLAKFNFELKRLDYDFDKAFNLTLKETTISNMYTSLVLIAGFSVFIFSSFGGTYALGVLSVFSLFIGLLTNLFLFPSLILDLSKRGVFSKGSRQIVEIE